MTISEAVSIAASAAAFVVSVYAAWMAGRARDDYRTAQRQYNRLSDTFDKMMKREPHKDEGARATVVRVGTRQVLSVQHQDKRESTSEGPSPWSWMRYGR